MAPEQHELFNSQEQEQDEIEKSRVRLLDAVASSAPETLEHRVAWILNNHPETRNSDITLQLQYWKTFHFGEYNPFAISGDDLYRLPRLTSLARARAKIQNKLKLFLADTEVRRQRGTLEEEERERATEDSRANPVYSVYIDESGKTQINLIVGSFWILHGPEAWNIVTRMRNWREERQFHDELHFAEAKTSNLSFYKEAVDLVAQSTASSFKVITVPRAGVGSVAGVFPKLIYHLLMRGIEHENSSGRAPLPRNLQVWKDEEETGYDKLLVAELLDRVKVAAATQFDGKLAVDLIRATKSKGNDLIQIADVFTGSINRVVNPPNPPPSSIGAKDQLSSYVLSKLRISLDDEGTEQYEDMAVRVFLY